MTATSLDLSQIKTDALSSAATFRTLIGLGSSDAVLFNGVSIKGSGITSFAPRLRELTLGMLTIDRADGQAFSVTLGNAGTSANRGIYISAAYELAFTSINNPQNGQYKDVIIRRDTADILAQRRDTNAQTFRLYNTYTSDTSYERGFMRWNSNVLEIGTEAGSGGGSNRAISFVTSTFTRWQINTDGHLLGLVNRGYDLGGASNRCRTVFTKDYNGDGFVQLSEMGVPTTPTVNTCRIYAKDNGSGNTQLVSLMPDGVETILSEQNRSQISYPLTWNDGATTFTGLKLDVTDTASASNSLLMDLQVGGTSKESTTKDGHKTVAGYINRGSSQWREAIFGFGFTRISNNQFYFGASYSQGVLFPSGQSLGWSQLLDATPDLRLYRDASNTLAQRNGVNAQTFNIYNTYTSDTSFERLSIKCGSNFTIQTESGTGGGTRRDIVLLGGNAVQAQLKISQLGMDLQRYSHSTVRILDTQYTATSTATDASITLSTTGSGKSAYIDFLESPSAPSTPSTDRCRIYAKDNGSGKTQLVVLMPDGIETVLATET